MAALDTVMELGSEIGFPLHESALERFDEARVIHNALEEYGLTANPERAHAFMVFSPESRKALAISVTPYNSDDQSMEGGLSVSQGGHAQAVVVHLQGKTKIVRFTAFAMENGQVRTDDFEVSVLRDRRPKGLVADVGRIKASQPLIEITRRQAASIGSLTFNSLLVDATSKTVHSEAEIKSLRANASIINDISQFVLLRTSGSACCSCSCSCWGSSSCSCSSG